MTAALAIALLLTSPASTTSNASEANVAKTATVSLAAGDALGMQMHDNHGSSSVLASRQAAQAAQAAPSWNTPADTTRVASLSVR